MFRFTMILIAALSLLMMSRAWAAAKPAGPLRVLATTSIIGDWAKHVGGSNILLINLIGPDGDPHEYQAVPADDLKIADANLILENGLGLETWLPRLIESAGGNAKQIVVTHGVIVRHATKTDTGDIAGEVDPHVWQNVQDAIICVHNICDAFVAADPAHAAAYRLRTAKYVKQLESLDQSIAKKISSIPSVHRKMVTSHDAFGYFGQRYGLQILGSALESVTTDAADPSARQIATVIEQIRQSGVPAIFVENIQNPKLIDQIAADAAVKVGSPLYSDAIGKPGSPGDSYIKMMRYNADAIAAALAK